MIRIETEDKYNDGCRASLRDHVLVFRGNRYGVCSIPAGAAARRKTGGPKVPGPWADAFGLASVIDTRGGTGAESERNRGAGTEHTVVEGDRVEIDGRVFVVAAGVQFRGDYLRLDLVPTV